MSEAMANREAKDFALRCIERLPFVVGDDNLERAQRHMLLAFGPAASPQLRECTPQSIGYAIALSAMSGLMPGGPMPDVWLIPRRNKKNQNRLEVNWQISARGYIRLARRANWDLDAVLVYHGEKFEITRGTSPGIIHVPDVDTPRGWDDIRLGYAVATGPEGVIKFAFLRKGQIEKRRQAAETQLIWNEWPEEMALKAVSAYAGRRELFPCDPAARYAIESDVAEAVQPIPVPTSPAPLQLSAADFGEVPAPEPETPKGAEMSASDQKEFAKALRHKKMEPLAIALFGEPPAWLESTKPKLANLLSSESKIGETFGLPEGWVKHAEEIREMLG